MLRQERREKAVSKLPAADVSIRIQRCAGAPRKVFAVIRAAKAKSPECSGVEQVLVNASSACNRNEISPQPMLGRERQLRSKPQRMRSFLCYPIQSGRTLPCNATE